MCVGNASIHFECESITIRIVFPWTSPAKSIWRRTQGLDGQFHSCSGDVGDCGCCCWPLSHWLFNVIVQTRPPDIHSGQSFCSIHAGMTFMEFFKNSVLTLGWDNDSGSPQNTALVDGQFCLLWVENREFFIWFLWPASFNVVLHFREDRVSSGPHTNDSSATPAPVVMVCLVSSHVGAICLVHLRFNVLGSFRSLFSY